MIHTMRKGPKYVIRINKTVLLFVRAMAKCVSGRSAPKSAIAIATLATADGLLTHSDADVRAVTSYTPIQ